MLKLGISLFVIVAVALGGMFYWKLNKDGSTPTLPAETKISEEVPKDAKSASPKFPVEAGEATETTKPASSAPSSRPAKSRQEPTDFYGSLAELIGASTLDAILYEEGLLSKIVVAVANENTTQISSQYLPWKKVSGEFKVKHEKEFIFLDPENAKRYKPYLKAFLAVSSKKLAKIYVLHYRELQAAYKEAGNEDYFNDKLVAVIDDLLAAPDAIPPVELTQPVVMYDFAEEKFAALNAGQKIMARIGPENAAQVKTKLKELREELTHLGSQVAH